MFVAQCAIYLLVLVYSLLVGAAFCPQFRQPNCMDVHNLTAGRFLPCVTSLSGAECQKRCLRRHATTPSSLFLQFFCEFNKFISEYFTFVWLLLLPAIFSDDHISNNGKRWLHTALWCETPHGHFTSIFL